MRRRTIEHNNHDLHSTVLRIAAALARGHVYLTYKISRRAPAWAQCFDYACWVRLYGNGRTYGYWYASDHNDPSAAWHVWELLSAVETVDMSDRALAAVGYDVAEGPEKKAQAQRLMRFLGEPLGAEVRDIVRSLLFRIGTFGHGGES